MNDERIEAAALAIYRNQRYFELRHCRELAEAALAAAGVEELEEEVTRLRDAIAHAIIMLQTGMPEYDAHDVLDVLREVMGK
jgi:hypothetical protein